MAVTEPTTVDTFNFGTCPPGYTRTSGGDCVYEGEDPYTGGFDASESAATAWAKLKKQFTTEEWKDYGDKYFEQYDPFRETMLTEAAGVDIGQLGAAREFAAGQSWAAWDQKKGQYERQKGELGDIWDIESAEIGRKKTAAGDIWGLQETEFERQRTGAGTLWGLQQGELERGKTEATAMWGLREADITRQEKAAGTMWGLQKAGMEEEWGFQKGELAIGAQSGLRQARRGQAQAQRGMGFATAGTREFERMQKDVREQYGRTRKRGEAGLASRIGIGQEQLTQTLGGLGAQRGIGTLGLSQTLAGLTGQIGIGAEQLSQTQAGYGAQIGLGQSRLASEQAGFDYQTTLGKERLGQAQSGIQDLINSGQLGYEQAIDLGLFEEGQGITDINQALESDIYGEYEKWRGDQRSMYQTLMGMNIGDDNGDGDGVYVMCPDATFATSLDACTDNTGPDCNPAYNIKGQCISCCENA